MIETKLKDRIELTVQLLFELKKVLSELNASLSNFKKCSDAFYQKLYLECRDEIQSDIDKYKANVNQIRQLNLDITFRINEWYDFIKNPAELRRICFPLKFKINQHKLKKFIDKTNESISELAIENRFITEHLTNWEHQLELKAIQLIQQDTDYKQYELLVNRKNLLVSDLKYLLPTIPQTCPVELDTGNIDLIIEKLQRTPAA